MKQRIKLMLGMLVFIVGTVSVMAGNSKSNAVIFNAMSPYEDLTEYALAEKNQKITESLASLKGLLDNLNVVLSKKTIKILINKHEKMKLAEKNADFPKIALLAVDSYKVISEELDESQLEVPKQVVILDYVGFRIHALLKQKKINWDLIANTVDVGITQWKSIKGKVTNRKLKDSMNTTIYGLKKASDSKNIDMLSFAAQIDLDLVDLLEGFFENK